MGNTNMRANLEEAAGLQYAGEQQTLRHPFCKHVGMICLVAGMITLVVVWSCALGSLGVTSLPLGLYLLVLAIFMTLLEFSWLINKCACCGNEGFCCMMWRFVMVLDAWKRGVFYVLACIPCFVLSGITISALGAICGILLFICGLLYISKAFQFTTQSVYSVGKGDAKTQFQTPSMQDPAVVGGAAFMAGAGAAAASQHYQQQP